MELKDLDTKTLENELKRRKEAEQAENERKRIERCKLMLKYIDLFLELIPEHGRTSCSDEDPCNYYQHRCNRCVLLEIKRTNWWDDDIDVDIYLRYTGGD